jgi:hypothetical protein
MLQRMLGLVNVVLPKLPLNTTSSKSFTRCALNGRHPEDSARLMSSNLTRAVLMYIGDLAASPLPFGDVA